jgi:hypothetical protein
MPAQSSDKTRAAIRTAMEQAVNLTLQIRDAVESGAMLPARDELQALERIAGLFSLIRDLT